MRRACVFSLCLVLAGAPLWASAQDPVAPVAGDSRVATLPPDPGYRGVVPGRATVPSHLLGRPGSTPTVVTWPGFQPRADGASRFFLQLTSSVHYEVRSEPGRFVVTLHGVRIPDRQTRRVLDTSYFDTPVNRARVERRGRHDAAFVFELRADATPVVSIGVAPGGYTYIYVEFPPGHWLPRDVAPAVPAGQVSVVSTGNAAPSAPASSAPASSAPVQGWTDPERPPDVGGSRRGPQ